MSKLPEPPSVAKLAALGPEPLVLPAGTWLWRIYFRGGTHPGRWDAFRSFGPLATARFDHHAEPPSAQKLGILYAAARGPTCVAEVFQETRTVDRAAREPWLVAFATARDLHLHDLRGTWPTRAGASTAIHSGRRDRARAWSRALYAAFPAVDGLAYCSSMDANRPAYALYERAKGAVPGKPVFHKALADPGLATALANAAREFGYALL